MFVRVHGLSGIYPKTLNIKRHLVIEQKERLYGRGGVVIGQTTTLYRLFEEYDEEHYIAPLGSILSAIKESRLSVNFLNLDSKYSLFRKIDVPKGIAESPKFKVDGEVRKYFYEALEACRKNFMGFIVLPPGSGKTEIQITLATNQLREYGTGIILVPSNVIKSQFLERCKNYHIPIKDYAKNRCCIEENNIYISLPKILVNDLSSNSSKDLEGISWILVDEAHHTSSNLWHRVCIGLSSLKRIHGFSAISHQDDKFAYYGVKGAREASILGSVLYKSDLKTLGKFLDSPKLLEIEYKWGSNWSHLYETNQWQKIQRAVSQAKDRNQLLAEILLNLCEKKYLTIMYVTTCKHGEEIFALCKSDPRIAIWYGGGDIRSPREDVETADDVREFCGKSLFGIISTNTYHMIEGLDISKSPIDCVVLCIGRAVSMVTQITGRVTRPNNREPLVINIWDIGVRALMYQSMRRTNIIKRTFNAKRARRITSMSEFCECI